MHFELFDQYGVIQILPAGFLVFGVLFLFAFISQIYQTRKLKVATRDKAISLVFALVPLALMFVWYGVLIFIPNFSRDHFWLMITPIYLVVIGMVVGVQKNKDALVRIREATTGKLPDEQKQRSRRQGRRAFWVVVALLIGVIVAVSRWKP